MKGIRKIGRCFHPDQTIQASLFLGSSHFVQVRLPFPFLKFAITSARIAIIKADITIGKFVQSHKINL